MNDELFLKLRSMAQQAGCSTYNLIRSLDTYQYVQLFGQSISRSMAGKLYRDFKDAHFYRLYLAGAVKPVQAEQGRIVRGDEDARRALYKAAREVMSLDHNNALHYVGCSKGSMSSTQPNLQSIPKAPHVNKTTDQLREDLAASEANDARVAEIEARSAKLRNYRELLEATDALLQKIGGSSIPTTPSKSLASRRFELKALAAEFGYRIVLVGDRTQAVLVQQ